MRRQSSLLGQVAGDDRGDVVVLGEGGVGHVEPQLGLPAFFIEAVALEAVFGKDRPDVAVVVELRGSAAGARAARALEIIRAEIRVRTAIVEASTPTKRDCPPISS